MVHALKALVRLKDMAERLLVGAARDLKSPSFTSFGSNLASSDVLLNSLVDQTNGQTTSYKEPVSSGSNTPLALNGSTTIINCGSGQNKAVQSESTAINGSRSKDGEAEWVEQHDQGVYITFTSLPGGIKDLKRVRFRVRIAQVKEVIKPYTPTSLDSDVGYFELVTKMYPQGQSMSHHFREMKEGDYMAVKGPK